MADRDDKNGRFLPGNSGNGGRKPGSRSKLASEFIDALHADFEQNGAAVIAKVRIENPSAYLKVVANLMPARLEAQLQAEVDVNVGFRDTDSIADVLTMVAKEAGREAAITLAGMFGIKDEHYPQALLSPVGAETIENEVCPHAAGSDAARAWHKRRGVG
jgi:hypothetical protein